MLCLHESCCLLKTRSQCRSGVQGALWFTAGARIGVRPPLVLSRITQCEFLTRSCVSLMCPCVCT